MDEGSVDVSDERALGYREFGDPNGQPVVTCHGGLVCSLDVAPFHDAARELGVRIISPDRPGIALSDPASGRTTADWADDVCALIDALGVARTAVLGWSMGGQYALACAARIEDRVTRTVVIAGAVPLDDDTAFAELNSMDRRFTHHRAHARLALRVAGRGARPPDRRTAVRRTVVDLDSARGAGRRGGARVPVPGPATLRTEARR
jgi:pimeloyl-ACP methyl ester carboxylesterase